MELLEGLQNRRGQRRTLRTPELKSTDFMVKNTLLSIQLPQLAELLWDLHHVGDGLISTSECTVQQLACQNAETWPLLSSAF